MKSSRYAEWLSVTANFAVVAGIIFLAVELQQNNALQQSEARTNYMEHRKIALENLFQNDALLESIIKARKNQALTELEAERLSTAYRSFFVLWEWEYDYYIDGLLTESPHQRWKSSVGYYPLIEESWATHKITFSPTFAKYMNENVFD
jgi:hypothetical protein